MKPSIFRLPPKALAPLAALAVVTACATATPYQPLQTRGEVRGGYSEQRIEENRWRVSFTGNSFTSRHTVETYLLYRAAELTLQNGYDGFMMATRNTDANTTTHVWGSPWGPGWGWWGPSWRYYGRGWGWRSWDPWWGSPFWADTMDVTTVTEFEASAEIVMFKGPKRDDHAFDARQVMQNLGPTIQMPVPKGAHP